MGIEDEGKAHLGNSGNLESRIPELDLKGSQIDRKSSNPLMFAAPKLHILLNP
jgi:hypothetical protein